MTTVTKDSHWRHLGAVPYAIWKKRILDAGGLARVAAREAWKAAGDDSALMLEFLREESSYASDFDAIPASWNDPWNLQIAGVGIKFGSIVDCINAWRERMYSTTYKQGIYAKTKTIADLISTYAPKSDGNDTDGYITGVVAGVNRNGFDPPVDTPSTPAEPAEQEPPMADLVFGRVPKPPMKVMIVPKGASGQTGWFQCPPRHNVGFMAHETQGMSSGEWYYNFFSCPNGERCGDALVDFLIDPQGVIYMYNDPEGTRAPWANGGGALSSGGLEGDGVAYVDYFGLGAVDTKTISCEIVKNHGAPMTAKQIVSLGKLFAHYADRDQQPWTNWPAIAKYGGTRVYLNHFEIGTTNCFINPDDNDKVIAEVQSNMKAAQEGGAPAKPVYATADPMPAGTFVKNDRLFLEVNKEYTTQRSVKPFRYADFKPEQQTGPEIPKGTKVTVLHVVSDTGPTSDLTLEIDAVKIGDETVPKGSRIDGRVIA